MRWLDDITDSMDMNLGGFWETVRDRETWHATVHGVTESDRFQQLNNTTDEICTMLYVLNILLIKTKLCTSYYILQHLLRNYMSNVKVLIIQLYLTLCDLLDCSPPGSSVHGILQERILKWVAISSSGSRGDMIKSWLGLVRNGRPNTGLNLRYMQSLGRDATGHFLEKISKGNSGRQIINI